MNKTIKLNDTGTNIDLKKLITGKLLVQANSGGGKSHTIRRILEQSHGLVQHIVLDPEGEFSTLREQYEYILVGKDNDVEVSTKTAAKLAEKLLEFNTSAIIDLYELHPQERKHFVKLFVDALVHAPKKLWHPVLVVIDEIHTFAPEKGESEALGAVIGLASLGRKREFCLIGATQRISKLNKDVAAECNNKMIGRTGLDIDQKRAADELGFTNKEEIRDLRNLDAGEFYVYGPAISREVIKIKVGDVQTQPPKTGGRASAVPKPTEKIKGILAKLSDLPAEAKKEAETIQSLKAEITVLRRQKIKLPTLLNEDEFHKKLKPHIVAFQSVENGYKHVILQWEKYVKSLLALVEDSRNRAFNLKIPSKDPGASYKMPEKIIVHAPPKLEKPSAVIPSEEFKDTSSEMGKGERQILIAICQYPDGISREHLTVMTGYKRSTRDAYIQRLQQKGFVRLGDKIMPTEEGIAALGTDYEPLPEGSELRDYLLKTLPEGEAKILRVLVESYPEAVDRDELTNQTGYQRSTRDAYIQRLNARQLVTYEGRGSVKAQERLF